MARHGSDNRGLEVGAMPGMGSGRFGRMFPDREGPEYPRDALEALADAMIKVDAGAPISKREPQDENHTIPAGYTYFGQFVDHDLTFDPTPLRHQQLDVTALEDFRTPALDLDCVYGSGPADQPYLYERDQYGELRLGEKLSSARSAVATKRDVLRLLDQTAILGDKRNDENKIVAQMQSTFIALHNRLIKDDGVLRSLGGDLSSAEGRFRAAVCAARWHYQWVAVFDFLANRLCAPGIIERLLNTGGMPCIPNYTRPKFKYPYMPVEFSGAAYRFGHSIVRPSYALNAEVGVGEHRIPIFSQETDRRENLNGFGSIPDNWGIDWAFFLPGLQTKAPARFQLPQPSYRMDAILVDPLSKLPEFQGQTSPSDANLAFRNLSRGNMLRLPTGEQVAEALGIKPLAREVLWSAGSRIAQGGPEELEAFATKRAKVFETHVRVFEEKTPLWYYILREAEYFGVDRDPCDEQRALGGQHLGPVGSHIVAETFLGLLWYDNTSFLKRMPAFAPILPCDPKQGFLLGDLLQYALG
jgi:hypothetical protein